MGNISVVCTIAPRIYLHHSRRVVDPFQKRLRCPWGVVMTSFFQAQRAVHLNTIPDQNGKTYLVTGGNTGIGYEVAKALAAKNAHVFMTARDAEKQRGCVAI